MKRVLLFIPLLIATVARAQCPPFARLATTTNSICIGTTLKVSTAHALSDIVWYQGNTPVRTVAGTRSWGSVEYADGGRENPLFGSQIKGIFVDDNGDIYLGSTTPTVVLKGNPASSSWGTVIGANGLGTGANQLRSIEDLYVDQQGNIYVADLTNSQVQKWAPGASSGVTVAGGNGAGSGADQLSAPVSVYVDCGGNVFVADAGNNRVQKWAPGASSGVTVAGGNGPGSAANQLYNPTIVRGDGNGNVYVLDDQNARVQKWAPGASSGVTVAGGNGTGPNDNQIDMGAIGMYVDYSGDVYIADQYNNRIVEWAPGAAAGVVLVIRTSSSTFTGCFGLFVDDRGTIFGLTDGNDQLLKLPLNTSIDSLYTPTAAGKYYAVVTDVNGAVVTTDTITVYAPATGVASIQISASATDVAICMPVSFTAAVTNGGTDPSYQWQVSGVNTGVDSNTYTNNVFANGDRVVCILTTVGTGCELVKDTSNAIVLGIDAQGHASVSISASDTAVCAGTPVNFTATVTNGSSSPVFQWLVDGVPAGDSSASYSSSSLANGDVVYCLITSDAACGLAKSNSIPIAVYPQPVVAAGQVFHIPYGQSLTLDPAVTGVISSYSWTPAAGLSDASIRDPVADPSASTQYTLQVLSLGGCQASGVIVVDVYTPLSIPNAFTPNGDGRNDVLYVLGGPAGSQIVEFAVFNRWGAMVFQVHNGVPGDRQYGWDGMIGGHAAPAGVYVYIVELNLAGGGRQVYKGSVMLIR